MSNTDNANFILTPYLNITPQKLVFYTRLEKPFIEESRKQIVNVCQSPELELFEHRQTHKHLDAESYNRIFGKQDRQTNAVRDLMPDNVPDNGDAFGRAYRLASLQNLSKAKYSGVMSHNSRKRLMTKINWINALSDEKKLRHGSKRLRFRLNFITLTLSSKQVHSDLFVKNKMLNPFLTVLRKKYGLKTYCWRAELQTENKKFPGNIHFHLTTNIFVPHQEIRRIWNEIQARHGYLEPFIAEFGHDNPNSTDVHAVHKIKNMAAYMAKYMAKDSAVLMVDGKERKLEGRQWFISRNVSKCKAKNYEYVGSLLDEVGKLADSRKSKFVQLEKASVIYLDIFTGLLDNYPVLKGIRDLITQEYKPIIN